MSFSLKGDSFPFWQMQHLEELNKINIEDKDEEMKKQFRVNWFENEDPSPTPPKCTVLWKELLRLKKQGAFSLSPSSSSSSSSSSSLSDIAAKEERKEGGGNTEKHVKRITKGLERTRTASIRIRPMIDVPILH